MAVAAFNFNCLFTFAVNISITVNIVFRMAIDASHPLIIMNVPLQKVVMLTMQFELFCTVFSERCPIAIRFHHTEKTDSCSASPIMAVDAFFRRYLHSNLMVYGMPRFVLGNCRITGSAQTVVSIQYMTGRTTTGTVITPSACTFGPYMTPETLVSEIVINWLLWVLVAGYLFQCFHCTVLPRNVSILILNRSNCVQSIFILLRCPEVSSPANYSGTRCMQGFHHFLDYLAVTHPAAVFDNP